MPSPFSTVNPRAVHSLAFTALAKVLPWRPYGRLVSVERLLDLILLICSLRLSLSAALGRFRFGFGRETARKALNANLGDDLAELNNGLLLALHSFLDPSFLKRRWDLAIDLHLQPFYGDKQADGVIGSQKKQGTKYFYGYATAVLIHPNKRYTVALIPLSRGHKPHEIVEALLNQVASFGLRLRGVVLDSGFDSGETILLLQGRNLSYSVPLRKKGKGDNNRNACFALPVGTITTVEWQTEQSRKAVKTLAVLAQDKGKPEVKVYAFAGWSGKEARLLAQKEDDRRQDEEQARKEQQRRQRRAARQARKKYRARFGIETSYRQKNEALARTTRKDVCYRLLLQGAALLLRQAWVYLTGQLNRGKKKRWVAELTPPDRPT